MGSNTRAAASFDPAPRSSRQKAKAREAAKLYRIRMKAQMQNLATAVAFQKQYKRTLQVMRDQSIVSRSIDFTL